MNIQAMSEPFELDDKYIISSLIKSGGMGNVYAGETKLTHRKIAVKILHGELADQPDMLLRFKMEAEIASSLNHPNIVNVFGSGVTSDGNPYLAMDFVEGESLADLLQSQGPVEITQCIALFLQLARAVEYAHHKGVVHRDLTPGNVMLHPDHKGGFEVKLLDFGIAKTTSVEDTIARELTLPGKVFGSVLYMSPEQVLGKPADFRSDIYSFGCLLFHALTGKPPYDCHVPVDCMQMHLKESIPSLTDYLPEEKKVNALGSIITTCMQKDPAKRFESTEQLRSALESLSASEIEQSEKSEASTTANALSVPAGFSFEKDDAFAALSMLAVAALLCTVPFLVNLDLPKAQAEQNAKKEAQNVQLDKQAAVAVNARVDDLMQQAETAMRSGDGGQAESLARKAYMTSMSLSADDPKIADALYLLGEVFEMRQNYQGALQAFNWTLSSRQAKFGPMAPETATVRQRIRETERLMGSGRKTSTPPQIKSP